MPKGEHMNEVNIKDLVSAQKTYFKMGKTKDYLKRKSLLEKLKLMVEKNTEEIHVALQKDLGRPKFESFVSETMFVINEIEFTLKHLKKMMRPQKVSGPLVYFPSTNYIFSEPFGTILIISPWNYPFQLLISPLVGALAAGNTVILKPSEIAPHTAALMNKLISAIFPKEVVAVVEGGPLEINTLIESKMDYIFYTGSTQVGKIIYEKAAKFLTPVTLELGGKSPCIVTDEIDLPIAARRVMWGKFFNAGQTCVAPDYILISPKFKNPFINECKKVLKEFFGEDPKKAHSYGRIVSKKHFERLKGFLNSVEVHVGGETDIESLYFSPTIISAKKDSEIMKEEIFGPILPMIEMDSLEQMIDFINQGGRPLSLYVFSNNSQVQNKVRNETSSGGLCINDTLVHLSNSALPFGGVGESGIGNYHGKFSFDTFSHKKAVMKRRLMLDVPLRYPPFPENFSLIKLMLKYLG